VSLCKISGFCLPILRRKLYVKSKEENLKTSLFHIIDATYSSVDTKVRTYSLRINSGSGIFLVCYVVCPIRSSLVICSDMINSISEITMENEEEKNPQNYFSYRYYKNILIYQYSYFCTNSCSSNGY
jgi:hypothetical protein